MTDLTTTEVHSRTLTAFFDTRAAADQAISDLEAAGIPSQHISRVDGGTSTTSTTGTTGSTGFLASLKDMFMPEEDRYGYAEGLNRGGFLVSVRADEANYTRVMDILDRDGAVDMDEREASWRSQGWTGQGSTTSTTSSTTGYAATGAASTLAATGAASTLGATGSASTLGATAATARTTDTTATTAGLAATGAARSLKAGEDETISVYEEQLRIGKRDVSHGRVRLRSYVVETPVEEQVALRSERVEIERHPVDRAVTSADVAFTDRTLEAEEYAEEAIVAKDVRVKEEIGLRKVAEQRTETVSDKVRRTEVEIEDERGRVVQSTANETVVTPKLDPARKI